MEKIDYEKAFRKTIGKNIREYRYKSGLTAELLAEYAMLDEKNILKLESGDHNPRSDTIAKLEKAMNLNEGDLLKGTHQFTEVQPEEHRMKPKPRYTKQRRSKSNNITRQNNID